MSNLPSLMPNQQDIAEMARLRQIMEGNNLPAIREPVQAHYAGGSEGVRRPLNESHVSHVSPPAYMPMGAGREDIDAMKQILTRLNEINGDDRPVVQETRQALTSNAAPVASTLSGPYEVSILLKEAASGKEVREYDVVNANRQVVASALIIKESAQSIAKLLNKGQSLESKRIQEIFELEEDFNRNRIEATKLKQRYQRSMELGESAAADVFKSRHAATRANALAAQDQIKSIFESIR